MDKETERRRRAEKLKAEKDATGALQVLPEACADEMKAVEFFEKQRWGDTPACPRCGDTNVYKMTDRLTGNRNKRYLWRCLGCKEQFTVRTKTVFEDSRIELRHWCYAFWKACSSKKGVSALQIRRETGISYKSALFLMHRIRWAMTPDAPTAPKLTGIVEADETYVGGKLRTMTPQERRARKASGNWVQRSGPYLDNKVPVVAMIERDGQARAMVMPNVTSKNVRDALEANVDASARLMTDESRVYTKIGRRFQSHGVVKHRAFEYVRGENHINTAEGFFSRLKRQLYGTHHAVSKKHLHRYVGEVVFKHNTRKLDDGQRLGEAIKGADGKRLYYKAPTAPGGENG